jgi:hypothetical protein
MKLTKSKLKEIIREEIQKLNEGRSGAGAYINIFDKLLRKQMGKDYDKKPPSEKDIKRVMGLMRKRYSEPNMYER